MTDTPAARKPGRPATGRDPVVSIRLPKHMIEEIEATALHVERPAAQVYREALHLGLQFMKGERLHRGSYLPPALRPKHHAEVHEAGHAVAMFLFAQETGLMDPAEVVAEVVLKPEGAGHMRPTLNLSPEGDLRMIVAGAVAQAIDERVSFFDIWNGHGCRGDRKSAAKLLREHPQLSIERAAEWAEAKFMDPVIWGALYGLARGLNNGKAAGGECWELYRLFVEGSHETALRAAEHMGPVPEEQDERDVKPRRRAAKKKPRSR
jgi:hypothetical protein